MANYLEQLYPAVYNGIINPDTVVKNVPASVEQPKQYNNASSLLINFLNQNGINAASGIQVVNNAAQPQQYKNNLRTMFKNNEANILGVIIRTFNAKNNDKSDLIGPGDQRGTFNNAVERLDEVKSAGEYNEPEIPKAFFFPGGLIGRT